MKTEQEVVEKFVKQLKLPERKNWPGRQMLLCPVGLPGTGKTTVVTPMSEELGLVRVSSDELRKLLKENGFGWDNIKKLGFPVIEDLVTQGYSITFDMDCANPETVRFIEKLTKKFGVEIFWVRMGTPREFVFEKFRRHPPSWLSDDPEKMIQNYEAQEERYKERDLSFDYIYTFDTSRDDVQAQVAECINKIKESL